MYIKSVEIEGLFGRDDLVYLTFNRDLNILTGRNGSGKTTIMKLVWFIISGNILLALREVTFASCTVETDEYRCTVIRTGSLDCKVELTHGGQHRILEDDHEDNIDQESFGQTAEDKANSILMSVGGSIFFPTFRRIEGGFSLSSKRTPRSRNALRPELDIDEALASLSRKLTNDDHLFVSAISTQDVVALLLRRYSLLSEQINDYQSVVSRAVIDRIRHYETSESSREAADALLSETRTEIEKIETFRSDTMRPFEAVRELVERLFQHSGIAFDKRLSFGIAADAVNSDALSAGEKQMLSFICYNAFFKNSVVFVDEPELSLHVDWQRQLYTILDGQKSDNQFIFSTHSPFIYSKYPEKEVVVGTDRGE